MNKGIKYGVMMYEGSTIVCPHDLRGTQDVIIKNELISRSEYSIPTESEFAAVLTGFC